MKANLQKLAQLNMAMRHVLRSRMVKRAYDQDWVDTVKYFAETGQLAPESIEELKKLHDQGLLSKVLHGVANGAMDWGPGSALATGLWAALKGAVSGRYPAGAGLLGGALVGGGLGLGIGGLTGGIGAGWNYKKEKEQLKSILDALNAEEVPAEVSTTPDNELATAASM